MHFGHTLVWVIGVIYQASPVHLSLRINGFTNYNMISETQSVTHHSLTQECTKLKTLFHLDSIGNSLTLTTVRLVRQYTGLFPQRSPLAESKSGFMRYYDTSLPATPNYVG